MTIALAAVVVALAGLGAWRIRVLSQDVGMLDRELDKVDQQLGRAGRDRADMARHYEHQLRRAEAVTSQLHGEVLTLRRRVDGIEPWVALWASAEESQ